MEATEMSDIITEIESSARLYLHANNRLPENVALSDREYQAYKEQAKIGRKPMIEFKGRTYNINPVVASKLGINYQARY